MTVSIPPPFGQNSGYHTVEILLQSLERLLANPVLGLRGAWPPWPWSARTVGSAYFSENSVVDLYLMMIRA